jgi:hypothetical protein
MIVLDAEKRRLLKTTVRSMGYRSRTVQGVTLPEDVELLEVPQAILAQAPELQSLRYVVIADQIALVEPQSRQVLAVVE